MKAVGARIASIRIGITSQLAHADTAGLIIAQQKMIGEWGPRSYSTPASGMATKPPKSRGRKQDRPKKVVRNSKARRRIDEEDVDRSPITATEELRLDMEIVQLQRELEEVRIA